MELTERRYWEEFWNNITVPVKVDLTFSNDLNIAKVITTYLGKNKNRTALEVGCAPGKWLVFLAENFGYVVEGCEYLETASKKTIENLNACGVSNFKIHTGDFLEIDLGKQYDVILSLGFIEHFDDVDSVCRKHASLLNSGGIIIFGIPKLTGLNYFIAKQVDKTLTNKLIPHHNLSIMNLGYFNKLGKIINCQKIFVNTVGGFEPALFDISKCPTWQRYVFLMINLIFNNKFLRKLNLSFYSGYIMGVYRKE